MALCVRELWALRIHESFPAYLCLKRVAANEGHTAGLKPRFKEFYDEFLAVPGGPEGRPYLRPFSSRQKTPDDLWMNQNVAGSFSPSSLREGQAYSEVVSISGEGVAATYSLRRGHAAKALEHLAYSKPIPAAALATFLYRDYPLRAPEQPPIGVLLDVFKYEFGYEGAAASEFETLYALGRVAGDGRDWFEEV